MILSGFDLHNIRILLFITGFCGISLALKADEKPDTTKVYEIGEVTVTEQYRNTEVRSSAPLQILSTKQIEKLNALQVSDAVKYFSGVTVKDYGGIGGLKTVSVRSLGAAHTAVSYDGITLTDCQTGQIDIGRFSLDNVDMLSLTNGQSDNIFQPARLIAASSVLNIRTMRPTFNQNETFKGKTSLKLGSFGLLNPSVLFQKRITNKISALVNSEWLSANGAYPYVLDYSYLGNGNTSLQFRNNSDVKNIRVEGAVYANPSENVSGDIKFYFYTSERGLPGATILYNEHAFTSQRLWDNVFFSQGHYENHLSKKFSFQINAKYQKALLHYLDTAALNVAGKEESFFTQNEYYGSITLLYKAWKNLSIAYSTDGVINNLFGKFENVSLSESFPNPVRYTLLSSVAVKYVNEYVLATASVLSNNVIETTEKGESAANRNRFTPYASITYRPFRETDLRFRAYYKDVFRMPTFNDLYYARIGNVHLRPETTRQFNIGLTYAITLQKWLPLFSFSCDAYRNRIDDKIVAMPTKNLFKWTMVNLGKVEIKGVDITAESSMNVFDKYVLIVGGTYTYQKALDVTDPNSSTYLHQIPYTPRVSGSGKVSIQTSWVDINYTLLASGKRYALFQNYSQNRLPPFTDHSIAFAKVFKKQGKQLAVNFEVLNFLDKNYAIVKWFPMPGRSVRGTLALKF